MNNVRYAVSINPKDDGFDHGPFHKVSDAINIDPESDGAMIFEITSEGVKPVLKFFNQKWEQIW